MKERVQDLAIEATTPLKTHSGCRRNQLVVIRSSCSWHGLRVGEIARAMTMMVVAGLVLRVHVIVNVRQTYWVEGRNDEKVGWKCQ